MDIVLSPIFFGCLIPATIAAYIDWTKYRLPNYLTVTILITGLLYSIYTGLWQISMLGMVAGIIVGMPGVILRQMGMGDLKLMAGLGVWLGLLGFMAVLFVACIFGVALSVYLSVRKGQIKERLEGSWSELKMLMLKRRRPQLRKLPDDPNSGTPSGVIAFGTCLTAGLWIYVITYWQGMDLAVLFFK